MPTLFFGFVSREKSADILQEGQPQEKERKRDGNHLCGRTISRSCACQP